MTGILKYDEACRAIAAAAAVDEIKLIHDKAAALMAVARIVRNKEPQIQFAEILLRAERRLGEMILEQKETIGLAQGQRNDLVPKENEVRRLTLADLDIDRKLSSRAQRLGAVPPEQFEGMLGAWRERVAQDGTRVTVTLLKEGEREQRRAGRANAKMDGGKVADLHALVASGYKAGAILADPAWHFRARSQCGEGRSAVQHYDTQALDAIKALPIKDLASDDCALFLWVVDWCPHWAMEVIAAWGFTHKTTAFTWMKLTDGHKGAPKYDGVISDRDFHFGQGYWTRANPEDCWLATRGSPKCLHHDVRQLVIHPVMEHSRKPDCVHDRIERLVGGPYLEINARRARLGWTVWGDELPFSRPLPHSCAAAANGQLAIPDKLGGVDPFEIPDFLRCSTVPP